MTHYPYPSVMCQDGYIRHFHQAPGHKVGELARGFVYFNKARIYGQVSHLDGQFIADEDGTYAYLVQRRMVNA
jgi:hypothetical protein